MASNEVDIFHFPYGRNGVYPSRTHELATPLGAFAWRDADSTTQLRTSMELVVRIDLSQPDDLEKTIGLALLDRFPNQADDQMVLGIATQLLVMIAEHRAAPEPEPLTPWEEDLIGHNDPNSPNYKQ